MEWVTTGGALMVALAIIAIGTGYIANPMATAKGFGLPDPEQGPAMPWWLRVKGVRDIGAGLVVLAFLVWGNARDTGLALIAQAFIPLGDMALVLASKGRFKTALGVHGATAIFMLVIATLMLMGVN